MNLLYTAINGSRNHFPQSIQLPDRKLRQRKAEERVSENTKEIKGNHGEIQIKFYSYKMKDNECRIHEMHK